MVGAVEEAGEVWDGDGWVEEETRIFAIACGDGSSYAVTGTTARTFSSFGGVVNGFLGSLRRSDERQARWLRRGGTYDGQSQTRRTSGEIHHEKIRWSWLWYW